NNLKFYYSIFKYYYQKNMSTTLRDKLNYYSEFKEWYLHIREEFDFDYYKDAESRDLLSKILQQKVQRWDLNAILTSFHHLLMSKPLIAIYGCGPSLEESISKILKKKGKSFFDNFINLTADGASVLLREKGILIDAIFTDLDGITKDEFNYSRYNIIHAHGDNMRKIGQFEKEILEFKNVIGTTQVEPITLILNPGGFTDGDRILFFIRSLILPFQKLFLIGMDFNNIVGRYSKLNIERNQEASRLKKKKLRIAVELIKWIRNRIKNDIFFVNSVHDFNQYKNISIEEFFKIVGF
ncbi:MAG: 6-hydroxymethylpterin diphosphokinase MptE-like protein, partial [Candidatus Thorarchaeota archaeon]